MSDLELLRSAWDWEPSVVIGCILLAAAYVWAVRLRLTRPAVFYFAGLALLLLALVSPLDVLGDDYLFSAHMLQHLLLALMIPPLLLRGIPAEVFQRAVKVRALGRAERFLRRPAVAWLAGIGAMAAWHTPLLFNAALANEPLHIAQHFCFLVTGTIFWWPVLSPLPESRMAPVPWAAGYLFTACLACTLIGVALTFSPASIYPAYLHPQDPAGILMLVRGEWGLSAAADHQAGGLLMWVVGCLVYLCGTMAMFARWYGASARTAPVEWEVG